MAIINPTRLRLIKNIASNYFAAFWSGGLGLVFIPVYIANLGPEQWGVVALAMSLQAAMSLLDAGLSQIMPRDIAQNSGSKAETWSTYKVFFLIYACVGLVGFGLGQLLLPVIISNWLHGAISSHELEFVLRIVLFQFIFQFVNNSNTGIWIGTQRQSLGNIVIVTFSTIKHLCSLFFVLYLDGGAVYYVASFSVISAIEFVTNSVLVRKFNFSSDDGTNLAVRLRQVVSELGVLSLAVIAGMLISQLDRIFLARHIPLAQFGFYVATVNLGMALMLLQAPITRAFLPLVATKANDLRLRALMFLVLLVMCVLPAAALITFAEPILAYWLHNAEAAGEQSANLRMIAAAVAMNALYQVPYQLLLVGKLSSRILYINLATLVLTLVFINLVIDFFGVHTGGVVWLFATSVQITLSTIIYFFSRTRNDRKVRS